MKRHKIFYFSKASQIQLDGKQVEKCQTLDNVFWKSTLSFFPLKKDMCESKHL